MLRQTRTNFLQGITHARFEIEGMQSMHEQQTGNQFIATELIDHRLPGGP